MRILITALTILVATTASAQLSRTFTQDFVARAGEAEEFVIFLVEDFEVPNGVKQDLNEDTFYSNHSIAGIIESDSAFTFTEPVCTSYFHSAQTLQCLSGLTL